MTAVLTHTRWGPMLCPPYDQYLGQALIRTGVYAEAEFSTWLPYLPEGGVILDVGANIGCHTLPFAVAVGPTGRVIAFEPQKMLFYMLCGSIAMTGHRHVDVKLGGLGRESAILHVPPIDYTGPGNFGGLELKGQKEGEPVPCLALDAMKLPQVDFIKIDVEGMELDVLHGGKETIARCKPVLSVEADREQNTPATLNWLRLNGYRAWWHRPELGPLWPRVVSINLLCLPRDRELPVPEGLEVAID